MTQASGSDGYATVTVTAAGDNTIIESFSVDQEGYGDA